MQVIRKVLILSMRNDTKHRHPALVYNAHTHTHAHTHFIELK